MCFKFSVSLVVLILNLIACLHSPLMTVADNDD